MQAADVRRIGKSKPTDTRILRRNEEGLMLLVKSKDIDLMIPSFAMERTMRDFDAGRTVR